MQLQQEVFPSICSSSGLDPAAPNWKRGDKESILTKGYRSQTTSEVVNAPRTNQDIYEACS